MRRGEGNSLENHGQGDGEGKAIVTVPSHTQVGLQFSGKSVQKSITKLPLSTIEEKLIIQLASFLITELIENFEITYMSKNFLTESKQFLSGGNNGLLD